MEKKLLTKYDDVRLKGNPFMLEADPISYTVRYKDYKLELPESELHRLIEAIDVLRDHNRDIMMPPSDGQAKQWRQEERDKNLLIGLGSFTPDELRRAADLLEGNKGIKK